MTVRDELLKGARDAKGKCTNLDQMHDVERTMKMLMPIAEALDEMREALKIIMV